MFSFRLDSFQNEVQEKIENIAQSLINLRNDHRTELENLQLKLTQKIDSMTDTHKFNDFKELEERMCSCFINK